MGSVEMWEAVIQDTMTLVRQSACAGRPRIAVSPEVARMLQQSRAAVEPTPDEPLTSVFPETSPTADVATGDDREEELKSLAGVVRACRKCGLCDTRTQTVFSDGSPCADLVFVGEAPGRDEDRKGVPFVGRAGQLLTDIIVKGMKLRRQDVYICNVLKCRPPGNRNPRPDEVEQCEPYLIRQLELIRPKVICALGSYAAQSLLKTPESVGRLRGTWHEYHGIPLRVTYHPAYLLRNPEDKKKTWADIKEIMKFLDGQMPS